MSHFPVEVRRCRAGRLNLFDCAGGLCAIFGSRKEFVPVSSDLFVVHPLSHPLVACCSFIFFSFQMNIDAGGTPQSASAAPASPLAVTNIPGVIAAVNDPLQFGGPPVGVNIPGFGTGGNQTVAIPGFPMGGGLQGAQQNGSQPSDPNAVLH